MERLSDVAKLAMFDDLVEERNDNERCIAELRAELERYDKRFSALAWSLECALSIAKNMPMPTDEEVPPKMARKRKVGAGSMATANGEVRGASRLAGEASSAEGATSTVVLEGGR